MTPRTRCLRPFCLVKRVITYFGLAGEAPTQPAWQAVVETLPPLVIGWLAAWADGFSGWGGYGLLLLYLAAAWLVWLPLVWRFAPWRNGPGA